MKAILVIAILTSAATARADSCDALLKDGIFNKKTVTEAHANRSDFTSWLCSTSFKTHQEARAAGIGLGVPVYGVPLKVEGQFSESERTLFYQKECGGSHDVSEESSRKDVLISEVSDTVVQAWLSCKQAGENPKGVQCALAGDGLVLTLAVRHFPLDRTAVARVKEAPQIHGASCDALAKVKAGSTIDVGGQTYLCERKPDPKGSLPEVRVAINSSQGGCSAYTPARVLTKPRVVSGTVVLPGGTTVWTDDTIKFSPGARVVVEHGGSLVINANTIQAGEGVVLDGTGDRGSQGSQGSSGGTPPNPPGSHPNWDCVEDLGCKRRDFDDANSCHDHPLHADNGHQGGTGGDGGIGANIVVHAQRTSGRLTCKAPGGEGGSGGPGGFGMSHTFNGHDRFECLTGAPGNPGSRGHDGSCELELNAAVKE